MKLQILASTSLALLAAVPGVVSSDVPHDDAGAAIPVPDGAVEAGLRGSLGEKLFNEQVARAIDLDHEERSSEEDFIMSMPEVSPVSGSSDEEPTCYNLYSNMYFNPLLQDYPDGMVNPDENAQGNAYFKLCTDGTVTSSARVWGGKSRLNASHIHKCPDHKNGKNCGTGPPVINFCGTNGSGEINDAGTYLEECMDYVDGNSNNKDMMGMKSLGVDMSIEELVNDIGENPDTYYMNFHSDQSWSYWQMYGDGEPVGMCRGPLDTS